jgi:hypothetical protein
MERRACHLRKWVFFPIRSDGPPLAAMGRSRDDGGNPVSEDQRQLLDSVLDRLRWH